MVKVEKEEWWRRRRKEGRFYGFGERSEATNSILNENRTTPAE
jgi:hypothetical protein